MKAHTSDLKNIIKEHGRQLDSKITYELNGDTIELGNEELNSITPHYKGAILKSVMKQLDIDSNVEIPIGTILRYQFGVKVGNTYEYIDYGNYIVKDVEKQEDTYSYKITCYDKLLYSMKSYEAIKGKNLLELTATSQTVNGLTFTINDDGSILVNGTATAETNFTIVNSMSVASGVRYVLRGCPAGGSGLTYMLRATDTGWHENHYDFGSSVGYEPLYPDTQRFVIQIKNGVVMNNKLFKPMLTDYANKDVPFEKYFKYPTTIKNYLITLCHNIGLDFSDSNFANYNKTINEELFLDTEGRSMDYTYRDVLDQIAEVSGGTICIDKNDKVEVRYINDTVGKNLFKPTLKIDDTDIVIANASASLTNDTFTFTATGTDMYFGQVTNQGQTYTKNRGNLIDVSNATSINFYLSNDNFNNNYITSYDENKVSLGYANVNTSQGTYTLPSNTKYISFRFGLVATSGTTYETQVMISSSQITSYEPYGDTIDEEYLKDVNVNFGEKFGPVNTIILSRGGDGDKISLSQPTNLADEDKIAIQITDNQIMNGNDRDEYLAGLLNKLYGLEYYINDFSSTGICYLDLCDKYNIKIGDNFYSCIMFNDEVNITQGLEELIYTDMQEENEQDYKYIGSTDRGITQANIIAKKNEATITEYTQKTDDLTGRVNAVETKQTATDVTIGILGTNIDDDGNITAVKVKEGFTFNEDGFQIYNDDTTFKTVIDETGTYYYDGTEITGQYTKDGSKQKDLQLFGVYYYGMDDKDDDAMFVAQLYTDENGDEGFGHFYNRGD